jgi:hypothetical protein
VNSTDKKTIEVCAIQNDPREINRTRGLIALVPLEILHLAFVFFGGGSIIERAQVASPMRFRVGFA